MRNWTYSYKTADGMRHEGEMSAPSKDDVYAELRRQGIRAIKVTERIAPIVRRGFRGLRKRDWLLVGGILLVVALASVAFEKILSDEKSERGVFRLAQRHGIVESEAVEVKFGDRPASARPRKQLSVDVVPLLTNLVHSSERFLARFAQPGVEPVMPSFGGIDELADDFYEAIAEDVVIRAGDSREVVDLKRIVVGLKEDGRLNLTNGRSFFEFVEWLEQRQKMEVECRRGIVEGMGDLEAKNARLRALNFPQIPR